MKNSDFLGCRFGKLTVMEDSGQRNGNSVLWQCKCDCGGEILAMRHQLAKGVIQSCGCVPRPTQQKVINLTGRRFGRLTALYHLSKEDGAKSSCWHCRCDCGKELDVRTENLLRGRTQSCGCWNREQSEKMHDHMHYQNNTCVEMLKRACSTTDKNKAGFRGLFLAKSGKYRVTITFQKKHYTLGYYRNFDEAVRARLRAEEDLHTGYISAFERYSEKATADPAWAEKNPFFYQVTRVNGDFQVHTNGE